MPIRIPSDLPAQTILNSENVFVMEAERARTQDIRPLQVGILNLMPNKIQTEVQLCRLLSNTPLQINIDLIRVDMRESKHTPQAHMDNFYVMFETVVDKFYDGLIITGAPLALMPYEDISYWREITRIMDWARNNVQSTLYLCWAAHAAMYHHYGVNRELFAQKLFGVFEHRVMQPTNELVRGFDETFSAPHSRFGNIPMSVYQTTSHLNILAGSAEVGAYLVASKDKRIVFLTGHPEYDAETLALEYQRDQARTSNIGVPKHYFVNDDPSQQPKMTWRAHGALLFANWVNYYVYQTTPYDLANLSAD